MSNRSLLSIVSSSLMAFSLLVVPSLAVAQDSPDARMVTFDKATGGIYFALSLNPNVPVNDDRGTDVLIVFDTSASQTGLYRDDATDSLQSMLASFGQDVRVKVIAVDLNTVEMNDDFVAPADATIKQAMDKLADRVPLGSTDMANMLRTSADAFPAETDRKRAVIYIGDGMSKANVMKEGEFAGIMATLVKNRISVSSFAIGPQRDILLLATVANHTGGMVFVDSDDQAIAMQAGTDLARVATSPVLWPTSVKLPEQVESWYPARVPPLRTDRDSILIGTISDRGEFSITMDAELAGKPVALEWAVSALAHNEDYNYLPHLTEMSADNEGVVLPTLGSAGLDEVGRSLQAGADNLAKLSRHALRSGDLRGAHRLANQALRQDPKNPEALAVKFAARQAHADQLDRSDELRTTPVAVNQPEPEAAVDQAPGEDPPLLLGNLDEDPLGIEDQNGLLGDVLRERQLKANKLTAEVVNGLKSARDMFSKDPEKAKQDLKILLGTVEAASDIPAETRRQLRQQIESLIRESGARQIMLDEANALSQARAANAARLLKLSEETAQNQLLIQNLMEKFNMLMDEGKYLDADAQIAKKVEEMLPFDATPIAGVWMARFTRQIRGMEKFRDLRHKNFADVLYEVEEAFIPFPANPPIIYPDAEIWHELTMRRRKYVSQELTGTSPSEARIVNALDDEAIMEFFDVTLVEVADQLSQRHNIPIFIDEAALEDVGLSSDTTVNINLRGITLRSGLRLMLNAKGLTYFIKDEVLKITTPERAENEMVTRVYPVGDLVIPIMTGMSPLMGGGMMGGMGGGGGGGMGGGGMGGGRGGGMGGGRGGGGGGGFFAVEDKISLTDRTPAQPQPVVVPVKVETPAQPAVIKTQQLKSIRLTVPEGQSLQDVWNEYFASSKDLSEGARIEHAKQVRYTARVMMKRATRLHQDEKHEQARETIDHVIAMLMGALRYSQPQPWMYEGLGLALRANHAPLAEVERALMSAVDYSTDVDTVLYAGLYMADIGLSERALKTLQDVSLAQPYRPEPYVKGLQIAKRLGDEKAIEWAVIGILSQAWTQDQRVIEYDAQRVAEALLIKLKQEKRLEEAAAFEEKIRKALQRDCRVVVTWTGKADIDIQVQEPTGTLCSLRNPRTASGGVLMGDTFAGAGKATIDGYSETYICPQGYIGEYRMLVRRVWGEVTAGKVTVDIFTQNPKEPHIHRQIDLGEKDAVVVFEVAMGRRVEPLGVQQLENLRKTQRAVGNAMLAQQVNQLESSTAVSEFALARRQAARDGRFFVPRRRGMVGSRPIITVLPEGSALTVQSAIVSPDRRYVRISIPPFPPISSSIGAVSTFNFATGQVGRGLPDNDDDQQGGQGQGQGGGNR